MFSFCATGIALQTVGYRLRAVFFLCLSSIYTSSIYIIIIFLKALQIVFLRWNNLCFHLFLFLFTVRWNASLYWRSSGDPFLHNKKCFQEGCCCLQGLRLDALGGLDWQALNSSGGSSRMLYRSLISIITRGHIDCSCLMHQVSLL